MGMAPLSYKKQISEDLQKYEELKFILLNTMSIHDQSCLIKYTITIDQEENIINTLINNRHFSKQIIIYGKNTTDYSTHILNIFNYKN